MVHELVVIEPGGHLVPLHLSRGQDFFFVPRIRATLTCCIHTSTAWLVGRYIEVGTEKERDARKDLNSAPAIVAIPR